MFAYPHVARHSITGFLYLLSCFITLSEPDLVFLAETALVITVGPWIRITARIYADVLLGKRRARERGCSLWTPFQCSPVGSEHDALHFLYWQVALESEEEGMVLACAVGELF